MRICHLTSMHNYDDARVFQRACTALAKSGVQTYLIADFPGDTRLNNVNIIGLKKRSGISRRIFSSFEAFKKALSIKADIYHFHDLDLIPWMILLKSLNKVVVIDIHENYEVKFRRLVWARNLYNFIERIICNYMSGVVIVTESMKSKLNNVKKPKIVIGNIIYLETLKNLELQPKSENVTIYTSGNNSPARNCLQAVQALHLICKEYPDTMMIFAGNFYPADYKKTLHNEAQKLGVLNNLKFMDVIDWKDNFVRTSNYHIGCVFYEDNPNNRVTLPNRLFEYMYCKLSVIGEDFPEVSQIINKHNCGLIVNSSDPKSIADKIIYLLKNPSLIREHGENGRKAILEEYNYESKVVELIAFYKGLLA